MKTKGFTLVELLVVIAILAILATVSVVGYTSFIERAEQSNTDTEAHQIATSIESALVIPGDVYQVAKGCYAKVVGDVITLYTTDACTAKVAADATFDLNAADAEGDFAGLEGTLKVVSGTLVYVSDNGTDADVVAVGN